MPIKIAHIITRLIVGGAQENTLLSVIELQKKKEYDVTLISGPTIGPEGNLYDQIKAYGVNLRIISHLGREISIWADLYALIQLYRLIKQERYDIIHTHSSKAGIMGRIAAYYAGVSCIIHTIHGLPFHCYQSDWLNGLYIMMEKIAGRYCHCIVTVAHAMSQKAIYAGIAAPEKFHTVYSGMDLDLFLKPSVDEKSLKQKLGIPPDTYVIGKIARLFHLKGHDMLLRIAPFIKRRYDNVIFLLIGGGILEQELRRRIKLLGMEKNFIFTGLVTPEEIPGFISIMDIVVHLSLREGLARVIPQAFAVGKPVITYALDGAPEMIDDGINGFLVKPFDQESLIEKIVFLLEDPLLRKNFGMQGKKRVDPFFRKEFMVSRLHDIYQFYLHNGAIAKEAIVGNTSL